MVAMNGKSYISVILPLKLEWEPCYSTTEQVEKGDRVRVMLSGREYTGVVSRTEMVPDIDSSRIRPIIFVERDMEKIRNEEIELWRQVAKYYMCSIGEVYKAAYPFGRINLEEARANAIRKANEKRQRLLSAMEAKISRLHERLEKKQELADKAKEGTKAKTTYLSDIIRITEEIERAEGSRMALLSRQTSGRGNLIPQLEKYPEISLTDAQKKAFEDIKKSFGEGKPVLLHGVTGAGKTEIYIKLAQEALDRGENVLYLVPEIALSRQLEDRLLEHFGESLLTFHSGESASSRRNTAETIRNAGPQSGNYIVLCTRSGLFLPHHDLGLIIVDEEHDSSYKQDSPAPRYNGRDTALMLSQIQGSNIILGSATPSLEEIYNTSAGRHTMVRLTERFHRAENAEIEIIDTKAERLKRGMSGNFSRKLIDHMNRALANGKQILLLRSRRAWATILQCEKCGEIQKCPHCNVSMSYHKADGQMVCHYCGNTLPFTGTCSSCGGPMTSLGAGTQRIEEEAAALFPSARIARLDSDTAQNKSLESKIIKGFAKGEIDILVGTQMITKGFDFGNLSLVAVISADSMLGIQDFRADEKTLHILEQFRGRCGRRNEKGLLVVQTAQPEHPIYQSLIKDNQETSSRRLMLERKDFDFPPYSRIIEITVKDMFEDRVSRMSFKLAEHLATYNVTGPYSPVIDKIADQHIRKIRLSLKKDKNLVSAKQILNETIRKFEKDYRYDGHIIIDVDPS